MSTTRRDTVFFVLSGFFLTNALVAEIIGGKLFSVPPLFFSVFGLKEIVLSVGVIPWPVVFVSTDIINEYYGKPAVRRLSLLAACMIAYAFLILFLAGRVPTWARSPISQGAFDEVALQSMWIIVGSITAFLTAQIVDVLVFWYLKQRTGHRMLWLRATGSTAISQLIDSFVVAFIGFVVPGKMSLHDFAVLSSANYTYKLLVAIAATPLIYLVHGLIDRYMGRGSAQTMERSAERVSG
jgi:queuosine precursor transporter